MRVPFIINFISRWNRCERWPRNLVAAPKSVRLSRAVDYHANAVVMFNNAEEAKLFRVQLMRIS